MDAPKSPKVSHLAADELTDYFHGILSRSDEDRIREHLISCRECADLLLDLEALYEIPGTQSEGQALEKPSNSNEEMGSAIGERGFRRVGKKGYWQPALAAALLLLAVGLTSGIYRNMSLFSPDEIELVQLQPTMRGLGAIPQQIPFLDGERILVAKVEEAGPIRVDVLSSDGKQVATYLGLIPKASLLEIPVEKLEPGVYRVVLQRLMPESTHESIEEYTIQITQ